jgi:NADH-quinone oxidoreductase subunit L
VFYNNGLPALWLIPALPALGALIIFIFASRMPARAAGIIACSAISLSFLWVLNVGTTLVLGNHHHFVEHHWNWIAAGPFQGSASFYFDLVTFAFTFVVAGVGLLIHLYSYSYMKGDAGERRYFGYFNLFAAAMLVLVTAENAFFMFLGWEGVGACSFFLIGHWYQKSENTVAATKAFLVTRLGDIFLLIGLFLTATLVGVSFSQQSAWTQVATSSFIPGFGGLTGPQLILITGICFLLGAAGKSAQVPLQVWLPDAMAGPTPVSALIHAATMVTAGVYLIARFHILFALSPNLMLAVAIVGVLTAFYGATSAFVQTDIKRILAYSTISQIGYMFLGLGVGAWSLAVFHFFTHAFYKALLFMAAGTVIHSLHNEQNIYNMGGLRTKLKGTYLAFLAGAASLAGIPFITAGFYSKDAILWNTLSTKWGSPVIYGIAMLTALMTAIYSFRLIFVVFHGTPRKDIHVHLPDRLLTWPLYILAFFAIVAGFLNLPIVFGVTPIWEHSFARVFGEWQAEPLIHSHAVEWMALLGSGVLALGGAGIAWLLYSPAKAPMPEPAGDIATVENNTPAPYKAVWANFLFHGWKMDGFYNKTFVRGFRITSGVIAWIDRVFVDGIFEAIQAIVRGFHALVIFFQNGRVSRYAMVMLFGAVAIITILLIGSQR